MHKVLKIGAKTCGSLVQAEAPGKGFSVTVDGIVDDRDVIIPEYRVTQRWHPEHQLILLVEVFAKDSDLKGEAHFHFTTGEWSVEAWPTELPELRLQLYVEHLNRTEAIRCVPVGQLGWGVFDNNNKRNCCWWMAVPDLECTIIADVHVQHRIAILHDDTGRIEFPWGQVRVYDLNKTIQRVYEVMTITDEYGQHGEVAGEMACALVQAWRNRLRHDDQENARTGQFDSYADDDQYEWATYWKGKRTKPGMIWKVERDKYDAPIQLLAEHFVIPKGPIKEPKQ